MADTNLSIAQIELGALRQWSLKEKIIKIKNK